MTSRGFKYDANLSDVKQGLADGVLQEKLAERPDWLEDTDSDEDADDVMPELADVHASPEFPLIERALLRRYEICAQCGGTGRCVVYKAFERERRRFAAGPQRGASRALQLDLWSDQWSQKRHSPFERP